MGEDVKSLDARFRFLSTMSHDIRTPMNSILGMATIAQTHIRQRHEKGVSDAECLKNVEHCVENVLVATRHMLGLVNDILDMSRIDSGRLEIAEQAFSLDELESHVTSIVRQQADAKGIGFICREHNVTDRRYIGDMMRISQILINILGNSVKFTGSKGEINWEIEQCPGAAGGATMVFTCRDNGRGMSAEFLPHLYEPFAQEERQFGDSGVGTGLGMSIVRQLVELMHGRIEVKSSLGVGTVFTVTIPLQVDHSAAGPRSLCLKTHEEGLALVSKFRFLIVEDVIANAEVISQMIELAGGRCKVVSNGAEGVEAFKNSERGFFNCILMDVRMPIMGGYEATRVIRALPREDAKTIPILAMTADAFPADIAQAKEAGMNAHIAKPVRFKDFTETLAQVVQEAK